MKLVTNMFVHICVLIKRHLMFGLTLNLYYLCSLVKSDLAPVHYGQQTHENRSVLEVLTCSVRIADALH